MKLVFLVSITDNIDKTVQNTICKDEETLANLLLHLDRNQYSILNIMTISSGLTENNKEFYKKNDKLETGK